MIEITHQPLDPERITAQVRRDTNGAVVTFLGVTRLYSEGKKVVRLEYEAYEAMARKKLAEICQEVRDQFAIEDVAIAHRIGPVDIGQISLVVAVASPHRKEAFLACHQLVDRLKETVPIWKKEFFEDGSRWVACDDPHFSPAESAAARRRAPT
jgi:molybdopterin synthase catalytic subunit